VDEYADMTGVSPRVLNTDDQAAEIRAKRVEVAQAQADAENQARQAQAARDMAQAGGAGGTGSKLQQLMNVPGG
jgi:regulator of protease activity HflC (stomatin/prohibitin superfamily)